MNQYKENLFKLIRKEEVIPFFGAGFSFYAGYPSAAHLAKLIYNDLSIDEQRELTPGLNLNEISEQYIRIKKGNKKPLLNLLKKVFLKFKPTSTLHHLKLAQVPHFKSILTTNYDTLIEDAFGKDAEVVDRKTPTSLSNTKTPIFKLHGDLNNLDQLIIAKSDYKNFLLENSLNDPYWSIVRERLIMNHILFIGYGHEDFHIELIMDQIGSYLGQHRKEVFLVAPNLKSYQQDYLKQKGIKYIDSTGEKLIEEILTDIKKHIHEDFRQGEVSPKTFLKFMHGQGQNPLLESNLERFIVKDIKGLDGQPLRGEGLISVNSVDPRVEDIEKFISGDRLEEITIPKTSLSEFKLSYNDIQFINQANIDHITLVRPPIIESALEILFEDGLKFDNLTLNVYGTASKVKLVVIHKSGEITFNASVDQESREFTNVTFVYESNEVCNSPTLMLEFYTLIHSLATGKKLTVTFPGSTYRYRHYSPTPMKQIVDEIKGVKQLFENLKYIEDKYSCHFRDFSFEHVTDRNLKITNEIIDHYKGETISDSWDEVLTVTMDTEDEALNLVKSFQMLGKGVDKPTVVEQVRVKHELIGISFDLGIRKRVFSITNRDKVNIKYVGNNQFTLACPGGTITTNYLPHMEGHDIEDESYSKK